MRNLPTLFRRRSAPATAPEAPPEPPPSRPEFRPLTFLRGPHAQTIGAYLLPGRRFTAPTREQIVSLPDGDALMLYDSVPEAWRPGGPMVLLVHGLTGSHRSFQIQRLGCLFYERNWRVVRMDLRGTGKALPLARRTYHGGRSGDVRACLEEMHRWSPESPLHLIGLSLGGNLVLKLAGEAGDDPVPNLRRVVACNPPIDMEICAWLLTNRRENRIYEKFFVDALVKEAHARRKYFPDLPPVRFPARMTLRLFDDLYTAPTCGFADALDYYRRGSAKHVIPNIKVETYVLTSRDDPFIAVEPFETMPWPASVTVQIFPYGGHLGYVGWDARGGLRWSDHVVFDWVCRPDSATPVPHGTPHFALQTR